MAHTLTEMCGLSYCQNDVLASWSCPWCKPEYNIRLAYESDARASIQVLVVDDGADIYVAFRGTQKNLFQWLGNFNFKPIDFYPDACPGCKVHSGLHDRWKSVLPQTLDALRQANQDLPNGRIFITGHSAGGAAASLMVAYLNLFEPDLLPEAVYTFGAPRVGNPAFMNSLAPETRAAVYRVIRGSDPVPYLPLKESNVFKSMISSVKSILNRVSKATIDRAYAHFGTLVVCAETKCDVYDEADAENPKNAIPTKVSQHLDYSQVKFENYGPGKPACGGEPIPFWDLMFATGNDGGNVLENVKQSTGEVKDAVKETFEAAKNEGKKLLSQIKGWF
eukprot:TRINITY_DN275_c0_g1_i3.p1 TRINITY_DN275_c0_g1~~TRINITY_DN275_c0_g1_i3.p1  ORF type:complete len:379 (-),score=152.55 TRINITY_DN275_c0_g1_i3:138-1142(-)